MISDLAELTLFMILHYFVLFIQIIITNKDYRQNITFNFFKSDISKYAAKSISQQMIALQNEKCAVFFNRLIYIYKLLSERIKEDEIS